MPALLTSKYLACGVLFSSDSIPVTPEGSISSEIVHCSIAILVSLQEVFYDGQSQEQVPPTL